MFILNGKKEVMNLIAGTGGVAKNDLVVISSGKVVKAAGGPSAATIVGIALETAAADASVPVAILKEGAKIQAKYTGSTKTTIAATDIGAVFDLSDAQTIDLDDTTGGCAFCVEYNNTTGHITFMIPRAFLYI